MTKVIHQEDPAQVQVRQAPRRSRWKFRVLLLLLVIAGSVILFLPTIIGQLCLSPSAISWVSGQPEGTITIGQAAFSWQGPVQLRNVTLQTTSGQPIANVESMTSEWSLWDILTQSMDTLRLKMNGVRYIVEVEEPAPMEGQLDVREAVYALQNMVIPRPSRPMQVTISGCTIVFQNSAGNEIDRWSNLSAEYEFQVRPSESQRLSVAIPQSEEQGTGPAEVEISWKKEESRPGAESLHLSAQGQRVSIVAADPWLVKYLGEDHGLSLCSGTIDAEFQRDDAMGWRLAGSIEAGSELGVPPATQQVAFQAPPAAGLKFESQYSKPDDALTVPKLELEADQASVQLRGSVTELSGSQNLDVTAAVRTPGNAIIDLLPAEFRDRILLEGVKFSQISISGSLFPMRGENSQPLTYSMSVAWDRALAYGLESRNGQINVSLSEGVIRAEPVNVPVNGGRVVKFPVLDTRTEPALLRFEPGVMLENITLTPEVCRDWLMYVSPTLAQATSADGRFSLILEGGEIPLGQLEKGELGGTVQIREGAVRPGPLAMQMLQPVSQVQQMLNRGGIDLAKVPLLTMKSENIQFRLQEGRVYHRDFGANVGDMRLATIGSMGLDQSLSMQLLIHFPSKWLTADRPVLAAIASEPIPVMITGTLQNPVLDASGMAEFGKQIGVKAGIGILEKIIERRQQRNGR